jgi:hypothetical protein
MRVDLEWMGELFVDLAWEILCYYNGSFKSSDMGPDIRMGTFSTVGKYYPTKLFVFFTIIFKFLLIRFLTIYVIIFKVIGL